MSFTSVLKYSLCVSPLNSPPWFALVPWVGKVSSEVELQCDKLSSLKAQAEGKACSFSACTSLHSSFSFVLTLFCRFSSPQQAEN